jgi:membrane-bound lytic murein transglycosylase B
MTSPVHPERSAEGAKSKGYVSNSLTMLAQLALSAVERLNANGVRDKLAPSGFVGNTMRRGFVVLYTFCVGVLYAALAASAEPTPSATAVAAAEQQFAKDVATSGSIDANAVLATLAKARYQQSVIDTMSRPAESKAWKEYRPIFVNERRVADGVAFEHDNAALLARISTAYGVPPEIIVTILGVETNYGHNSGHYRVLDALTTLAFYYPPRQDFFRDELKQLLLLRSPTFPYAPEDLIGSYAGAMGWGQFMPSSIARFARDGDGDGKIDLWNSLPDICASVANYFIAHGWQKDGPVALRAQVDANARSVEVNGLVPAYSLQQLAEWGYKTDAKLDPMTPATLIRLDGADGPEVWITFENFYAISRYNKSPLYSLAVYQLSQAIAAGVASPP